MNLAEISIKRPIFITCLILLMLSVGWVSMKRLGVDLFPDVTFPVVTITTPYLGAGPAEVETLISRPMEDELSSIAGIRRLSSINQEGVSTVVAEFTLETDVKYAEQQIRDRIGAVKRLLPKDSDEPVVRRIDPADQPVLVLALEADLKPAELFDLADEVIRPKIEQVNKVGLVEVIGGRKREIHVELDRARLKQHELSVTGVANRLRAAGEDVPVGKIDEGKRETVFRSIGQFTKLEQIEKTLVSFYGSEVPVTLGQVGTVSDVLKRETSRAYVNGKQSLQIMIFKQSGSNTLAVVDGVKMQMAKINTELQQTHKGAKLTMVRDGGWWIKTNVDDVRESILLGVILAVLVVYLFLGSGRSTIITGLALPNSLIGAFILMAAFGFTINIMTLLALSLTVGLLVDDAIVVRENIFRHMELGKSPMKAALEGTAEVRLAVIATTLTVIAVFGPVGFLKGVVGQFFKQFGLTVCFAMLISLFDALTIAPMLSAYFATAAHEVPSRGLWGRTVGAFLRKFGAMNDALERFYERILGWVLDRPIRSLFASFIIFIVCMAAGGAVTKTFLPPQDAGEFAVGLDMPPGTSLETMAETSLKVDEVIRSNPEVEVSSLTVGNRYGEANVAEFYIHLVPAKMRKLNTGGVKDKIREQMKQFAIANPKVKDYDAVGGGMRPFNVNIIYHDQKVLEEVALKAFDKMKVHPGLKDADINYRPGKPEFQVTAIPSQSQQLGVSTLMLGSELRAQMEGVVAAKFRDLGREYDIRVQLTESQRNLREGYQRTYIPNINEQLVRLADVASGGETTGPAKITRQDRGRYIQISGDIAAGAGMADIMRDVSNLLEKDIGMPPGMRYAFVGQAENFTELADSMKVAMGLGMLFVFLVLASLYESFITPFTIMLALPLAVCGSMLGLFVTGQSLNLFSMIGVILLLGVASKNSILLVDYANQLIASGSDRKTALMTAGRTRLRPILMTTMALIAGTVPIALGLNEASRQRTSMGAAIIGGLVSSTLLTLIVVPAAFSFIDRFRIWSKGLMARIFQPENSRPEPTEELHSRLLH